MKYISRNMFWIVYACILILIVINTGRSRQLVDTNHMFSKVERARIEGWLKHNSKDHSHETKEKVKLMVYTFTEGKNRPSVEKIEKAFRRKYRNKYYCIFVLAKEKKTDEVAFYYFSNIPGYVDVDSYQSLAQEKYNSGKRMKAIKEMCEYVNYEIYRVCHLIDIDEYEGDN